MEKFELKPNRDAYVKWALIQYFIGTGIALGLPTIGFVIGGFFFSRLFIFAGFFFVLWLFISILTIISLNARYKKEHYVFYSDKIASYKGGIISDAETELLLKNVTHVKVVRPWLENKFYNTGSIQIQSAGSGGAEASLKHIDNPEKFYAWIQKLLKQNGFSLSQEELLREEKPNPFGAMLETLGGTIGGLFLFIYAFLGPLIGSVMDGETISTPIIISIIILCFVVGIPAIIGLVLHYQDLKNRTYKVYSDIVMYHEGFLSKHDAFIPVENVSDAETTQNLIDQIFGLYDVKISCQGAGQEILFKNLKGGKEMADSIDKIVDNRKNLGFKKQKAETETKTAKTKKLSATKTSSSVNADFDTTFTGEYKPSIKRAMLGWLFIIPIAFIIIIASIFFLPIIIGLFILLAISAFGAIAQAITLSVTTYRVKKESLVYNYKFLSAQTTEFTNDRITRASVRRNPFDYWMNTASVEFWSIGSGSNIKYQHIPNDIVPNLLAKVGVHSTKASYEVKPKYSVLTAMARNPFAPIFFLALFFGGIILAGAISSWFIIATILVAIITLCNITWAYILFKRAYLRCTADGIESHIGIIFKTWDYALYDNIKGVRTKKYLLSPKGSVTFNVAGESVHTTQKGQQIAKNNEIGMAFMPDIENKDELFDTIFTTRPSAAKITALERGKTAQDLLVAKPDAGNIMVPAIVILAVASIPPLVFASFIPYIPLIVGALWILFLGGLYISIKVRSYHIQDYRVIAKWGVFYKSQSSIVLDKIDHLNLKQGVLHKLFKNGSVKVYTVGDTMSGKAEMSIDNIKDHKRFYEKLKQQYEG